MQSNKSSDSDLEGGQLSPPRQPEELKQPENLRQLNTGVPPKAQVEEPMREEYVKFFNDFEKLLEHLNPIVKDYYNECGRPRTRKMNHFAMPPEINEALGPIAPEEGQSLEECVETIKTTFKYSVKTMHPFFMDKLYAGSDPIGQIADFIVAILNTAVHVYHVAPVFSVMEVECIKFFSKQFGFNEETCDGTINPGGSMSNMMAFLAARHEHFPHVRMEGWRPEDRPVAFTASQSHYSNRRGAMVSGMGMNQMREVPCCRETGQMIPEELEKMVKEEIEKGNKPFYVNSTAGTTVFGAYDDHHAIADICQKYGMWHHIDSCYGGYLIFADKYKDKRLFDGAERADSLSINAHKGLNIPNQCALLLVNNHPHALKQANMSGADYLFHESEYSKYDIADKTLSCGRRPDAFKLWLGLQRHGIQGYRRIANAALEKTGYIVEQIKKQPETFELVSEPMGTNICFWYTPPAFRGGKTYTDSQKINVHKLIFERMQQEGTMLFQHNPMIDRDYKLPNFFRLTLKGENSRIEDMDYLLSEVDRLGSNIDATMV